MRLHYKTYADLARDVLLYADKLSSNMDLFVGIPRSGMIPACMLGQKLSKPVCSLNEFLSGNFGRTTSQRLSLSGPIQRVLVIDDSVNEGLQMGIVKEKISAAGLDKKYDIKYAAVYHPGGEARSFVDIAMAHCPQPRLFQWNYLNHGILSLAAWDIDGLLCADPSDEDKDDGEKYLEFLRTAKPLHIPDYEISALVTSRLEKYRAQTEEWLSANGVRYGKLYMLDVPTAEERRRLGLYAKFKSDVFGKLDAVVFYESDPGQARDISRLSGKPFFCTATDELIADGMPCGDALVPAKKAAKNKPGLLRRIAASMIPVRRLRRKIRRQ
jgi:uncharacterized HAD superfamily protein